MKEDSGIRVLISMCLRGHHNVAGCNKWYLTFDQNACTNPESVAFQDYSASSGDLHRTGSS